MKSSVHEGSVIGDLAEDFHHASCQWAEAVCEASPEAYITYAKEAAVYCLRHYTLTLSQLGEVHVPSCSEKLSAHLRGFGRLGS